MDLHRVRRLAAVLVTSQLRAGRSGSDPRSWLGRPWTIGLVDLAVFLGAAVLVAPLLANVGGAAAVLRMTIDDLFPFLPLMAVAVVVVAGTLFELTGNAKFAGSDAVNWLPIRPTEYVAGSASAIAYTYSPSVAIVLGALLPIALAEGTFAAYLLTLVLTVVSLMEGAILVEMIRAVSARTGSSVSSRRGGATFVVRAILLVAIILTLDLALNPVFLLATIQRLSAFPTVAAAIPLVWSSRAIAAWIGGSPVVGLAFGAAQVAFVVLLFVAAAGLRARYWVPVAGEIDLGGYRYASAHPFLSAVGLSRAESALVTKDLKGFVRRRELLPMLVVPIVLVVLLAIEGSSFGVLGTILWVGWVAGLFALLLSSTSLGQERRALAVLFAFPIEPRNIFRAKAVAALLPVLVGALAMSGAAVVYFRFPAGVALGTVALTTGTAAILVLWGLVFASRFSDFQERPRPQFLRPLAMIEATVSGMAIMAAAVLPAGFALAAPSIAGVGLAAVSAGVMLAAGAAAFVLARSGFDALFRELPF